MKKINLIAILVFTFSLGLLLFNVTPKADEVTYKEIEVKYTVTEDLRVDGLYELLLEHAILENGSTDEASYVINLVGLAIDSYNLQTYQDFSLKYDSQYFELRNNYDSSYIYPDGRLSSEALYMREGDYFIFTFKVPVEEDTNNEDENPIIDDKDDDYLDDSFSDKFVKFFKDYKVIILVGSVLIIGMLLIGRIERRRR